MSEANENVATWPVIERVTWPAIRRIFQRWPSGEIGWNPGMDSPVHWLQASQGYLLGSGARRFTGSEYFNRASFPEVTMVGSFWLSAWCIPQTPPGAVGMICAKSGAAGREYELFYNAAGQFSFSVFAAGGVTITPTTAAKTLGQQYHLFCVADFERRLASIYLNGHLEASAPIDGLPHATSAPFELGARTTLADASYVDGDMAAVAFGRPVVPIAEIQYDALTALWRGGNSLAVGQIDEAVLDLWGCRLTRWELNERSGDAEPVQGAYTLTDNGDVGQATGVVHGYAAAANADNLLYKLARANVSNPHPEAVLGYDAAGDWDPEITGYLEGFSPVNRRWTLLSQDSPIALRFDDVSEDHVTLDRLIPRVANDLQGTIIGWVQVTLAGVRQNLISFSNNDSLPLSELLVDADMSDGTIRIELQRDDVALFVGKTPPGSITLGQKYHVSVTQDGTTPKVFIDAVDQTISWEFSSDLTKWLDEIFTQAATAADAITIGMRRRYGLKYHKLSGVASGWKYYNRALSPAEIASDYDDALAVTAGRVAYYPMSDGANNDGTLMPAGDENGSRAWDATEGRWKWQGDGSRYITLTPNILGLLDVRDFTIACRMKAATDTEEVALALSDPLSNVNYVKIGMRADNKPWFVVADSPGNLLLNVGPNDVNDTEVFLCGRADLDGKRSDFSVDGIHVDDDHTPDLLDPTPNEAYIGRYTRSAGPVYTDGQSWDVAVIPRWITDAERAALGNAWPADTIFWPLDDQPNHPATLLPQDGQQDQQWSSLAPVGQAWAWRGRGGINAPSVGINAYGDAIVGTSRVELSARILFRNLIAGPNDGAGIFVGHTDADQLAILFRINDAGNLSIAGRSAPADALQQMQHSATLVADQFYDVAAYLDFANNEVGLSVDGGPFETQAVTFSESRFVAGSPTINDRVGMTANFELDGILSSLTINGALDYPLNEGASGNAVIDGGPIDRWLDRSGSGNDVYSPTGLGRPVWDQAAGGVRFDGLDDGLVSLREMLLAGVNEITWLIIGRRDPDAVGSGIFLEHGPNPTVVPGINTYISGAELLTTQIFQGSLQTDINAGDRLLVASLRYSGGVGLELFDNKNAFGPVSGGQKMTDDILFVGCRDLSIAFKKGYIRESVIFPERFDDQKLETAQEYYLTKYAIMP